MRKNITALLQKGNLTPKERYLLLIQNDVIKATTGKEPLTEADKKALENWKAKDNNEAREWNKYNEGWKLSGRAGIEAEMIYWQTKADNYRKSFLDMQLKLYPIYRDTKKLIDNLQKIKVVDINEALKIANQQREQKLKDGIDFDYAVYQLAFESLSKELQDDLKLLYDEVEYDSEFLDAEETIAGLIQDKDKRILGKENREKLAELVADRAYNSYAKEYQLYHYFGSIPILEVAKRFLDNKGIDTKKITDDHPEKYREIIENYARDNKTTIKDILKETLIDWLEIGLPYTPIVISENKKTYNGDTKNPHNFIYAEWIKSKEKAKETLQKLIDKGELDEKKAFEKFSDRVITGESLYGFKGEFEFAKDFKKRVDEYNANLGIVYADDDAEQKGEHLDQELLIAEKDRAGKLNALSLFNLTTSRLGLIYEATNWIKETQTGKETYLSFSDEGLEKVYKEIRESLIKGYARLLAYQQVFKRLVKTYKCDLDYALKERVKNVGEFIDSHNEALSEAIGQTLHGGDDSEGSKEAESWLIKRRGVLKTKDDLFIKKDSILADSETLEEWTTKFEEILGDDF